MRRAILLAVAIAAAALPASTASAEPLCVWGYMNEPFPRTIPPTCAPYPLGRHCVDVVADLKPEVDGKITVCGPAVLLAPLEP